MWEVYVIGGLFVFFGVFVAYGVRNPNTKQAVFWKVVAEESGLEFRDKLFTNRRLRSLGAHGELRGYGVYCDEGSMGSAEGGPMYIRVVIGTDLPKDLLMSTRTLDLATRVSRSLLQTKIETGNPLFDEKVQIRGNMAPKTVLDIFGPKIQGMMLGFMGESPIYFELTNGFVYGLLLKKSRGKKVKPDVVAQGISDTLELAIAMDALYEP